jgi:effector-binding domain-containing protein
MLSEPKIITRAPQPYAAIRLSVEQPEIHLKAPPLIGEILGWAAQHAKQAGPAFFNYTAMEPGKPMEMEVGVPIEAPVKGDGRVVGGTLPGGKYATVTWTGPYDKLRDAHMALHDWLAKQKLPKQSSGNDKGLTLLEIYETDPDEVPDPKDWVTEIAFKLSDQA